MNLVKYLDQAGVPDDLHGEALASLARAKKASQSMFWFKWTAMFVMAYVVQKLKWADERLPAKWRNYDNDVSMNGDPWPWKELEDGTWIRFAPLEDTPEVREQCYWAKGSHPRSKWARYVWLGWRNRASITAFDLGIKAGAPITAFGNEKVSKSVEGVLALRMGNDWQIMSVKKFGPFAIRRNVGYKINNVLHNQHTVANVTWIGFSFPLWKG